MGKWDSAQEEYRSIAMGFRKRASQDTWNTLTQSQMESQLLRQAQTIGKMREALTKAHWRLFGAGVSTDPLFREIRDALGE